MERTAESDQETDWTARADRLGRIVAGAEIAARFPLLQVVAMAESDFRRLQGAATTYLWHSLNAAFPQQVFALDETLLAKHAAELLRLPNRTPNGVILPRRETFLSFNLIHQALAEILAANGMLQAFSHLQIPCNVRLVEGTPDAQTDARSYASTKIHTDVWNGEPVASILFNIPVLGDPQGVDLRFYQPRAFPEALQTPLTDYRLGEPIAGNVAEYPVGFDLGCIYVSDALSLHQTVKRRPTLRLSLDFRGIARALLPDETADWPESRAVYVTPEAWRDCGVKTILTSGEPFDAFHRRQAGETVARATISVRSIDEPS